MWAHSMAVFCSSDSPCSAQAGPQTTIDSLDAATCLSPATRTSLRQSPHAADVQPVQVGQTRKQRRKRKRRESPRRSQQQMQQQMAATNRQQAVQQCQSSKQNLLQYPCVCSSLTASKYLWQGSGSNRHVIAPMLMHLAHAILALAAIDQKLPICNLVAAPSSTATANLSS